MEPDIIVAMAGPVVVAIGSTEVVLKSAPNCKKVMTFLQLGATLNKWTIAISTSLFCNIYKTDVRWFFW